MINTPFKTSTDVPLLVKTCPFHHKINGVMVDKMVANFTFSCEDAKNFFLEPFEFDFVAL